MTTPRFRALVLRAAGTNCEQETVHALETAGASAEVWHVNRWIAEPHALEDVQLLVFPGGFTFGDDVASGAVFAYTVEKRLREQLDAFVARGGYVLGICNGFQVLVRLGLLPASTEGEATLAHNHSGRYEDRWVRLRSGSNPGPWLAPDTEYWMPVAHAEGRFDWVPHESGAAFPEGQVALRYTGESDPPGYPENPNGAHDAIAGVTNPSGTVLGLMPHPERFLKAVHHPAWTRYRPSPGECPGEKDLPVPLGLDLFRRIVASATNA